MASCKLQQPSVSPSSFRAVAQPDCVGVSLPRLLATRVAIALFTCNRIKNTTLRGIIASKMANALRTQMRIRISSAIANATCNWQLAAGNLQPPTTSIAMHRKSNCARLEMKFNTRSAALHKFCTYLVHMGYARLSVH